MENAEEQYTCNGKMVKNGKTCEWCRRKGYVWKSDCEQKDGKKVLTPKAKERILAERQASAIS